MGTKSKQKVKKEVKKEVKTHLIEYSVTSTGSDHDDDDQLFEHYVSRITKDKDQKKSKQSTPKAAAAAAEARKSLSPSRRKTESRQSSSSPTKRSGKSSEKRSTSASKIREKSSPSRTAKHSSSLSPSRKRSSPDKRGYDADISGQDIDSIASPSNASYVSERLQHIATIFAAKKNKRDKKKDFFESLQAEQEQEFREQQKLKVLNKYQAEIEAAKKEKKKKKGSNSKAAPDVKKSSSSPKKKVKSGSGKKSMVATSDAAKKASSKLSNKKSKEGSAKKGSKSKKSSKTKNAVAPSMKEKKQPSSPKKTKDGTTGKNRVVITQVSNSKSRYVSPSKSQSSRSRHSSPSKKDALVKIMKEATDKKEKKVKSPSSKASSSAKRSFSSLRAVPSVKSPKPPKSIAVDFSSELSRPEDDDELDVCIRKKGSMEKMKHAVFDIMEATSYESVSNAVQSVEKAFDIVESTSFEHASYAIQSIEENVMANLAGTFSTIPEEEKTETSSSEAVTESKKGHAIDDSMPILPILPKRSPSTPPSVDGSEETIQTLKDAMNYVDKMMRMTDSSNTPDDDNDENNAGDGDADEEGESSENDSDEASLNSAPPALSVDVDSYDAVEVLREPSPRHRSSERRISPITREDGIPSYLHVIPPQDSMISTLGGGPRRGVSISVQREPSVCGRSRSSRNATSPPRYKRSRPNNIQAPDPEEYVVHCGPCTLDDVRSFFCMPNEFRVNRKEMSVKTGNGRNGSSEVLREEGQISKDDPRYQAAIAEAKNKEEEENSRESKKSANHQAKQQHEEDPQIDRGRFEENSDSSGKRKSPGKSQKEFHTIFMNRGKSGKEVDKTTENEVPEHQGTAEKKIAQEKKSDRAGPQQAKVVIKSKKTPTKERIAVQEGSEAKVEKGSLPPLSPRGKKTRVSSEVNEPSAAETKGKSRKSFAAKVSRVAAKASKASLSHISSIASLRSTRSPMSKSSVAGKGSVTFASPGSSAHSLAESLSVASTADFERDLAEADTEEDGSVAKSAATSVGDASNASAAMSAALSASMQSAVMQAAISASLSAKMSATMSQAMSAARSSEGGATVSTPGTLELRAIEKAKAQQRKMVAQTKATTDKIKAETKARKEYQQSLASARSKADATVTSAGTKPFVTSSSMMDGTVRTSADRTKASVKSKTDNKKLTLAKSKTEKTVASKTKSPKQRQEGRDDEATFNFAVGSASSSLASISTAFSGMEELKEDMRNDVEIQTVASKRTVNTAHSGKSRSNTAHVVQTASRRDAQMAELERLRRRQRHTRNAEKVNRNDDIEKARREESDSEDEDSDDDSSYEEESTSEEDVIGAWQGGEFPLLAEDAVSFESEKSDLAVRTTHLLFISDALEALVIYIVNTNPFLFFLLA